MSNVTKAPFSPACLQVWMSRREFRRVRPSSESVWMGRCTNPTHLTQTHDENHAQLTSSLTSRQGERQTRLPSFPTGKDEERWVTSSPCCIICPAGYTVATRDSRHWLSPLPFHTFLSVFFKSNVSIAAAAAPRPLLWNNNSRSLFVKSVVCQGCPRRERWSRTCDIPGTGILDLYWFSEILNR